METYTRKTYACSEVESPFLDFDDCHLGHPADDLGTTLSALAQQDVRPWGTPCTPARIEQQLPWPDDRDIAAFAASRFMLFANFVFQDADAEARSNAPASAAVWASVAALFV